MRDHEKVVTNERNKIRAAITFIKALGARQVQLRFYDNEDPEVWVVVARFRDKVEVDADLTAFGAVFCLAERLVEHHQCRYCHKRVLLEADNLGKMPYSTIICWYQFDPEMKVFRRSCE